MPSLWLCLRPSPASGTLTSHALLVQTSLERMTSVGREHPQRICVYSNLRWRCKPIYLCQSDPTNSQTHTHTHTNTHTFNGPFSGTTQVSRYQKAKTNLDFTEARDSEWQWHQPGHMQCKSASRSRQITTPAPHHSVFYRPDALPAAQPTASKH